MNVVELRGDRYLSRRVGCGSNYIVKEGMPVKRDFCHSYSCIHCRRYKKGKLMNRVVHLTGINLLNRHLVITLPGREFREDVSPDESFKVFAKRFNVLKERYKRKFKRNMVYIAFPRSQLSGYCHYHCLIGSYIPKEWLQESCESVGLGFADIKYADVQRVRNYLSKYWYKEHEWFIPKSSRHFSSSRGIKMFDFQVEPGWHMVNVPDSAKDKKLFFDQFCAIVLGVRPPEFFWLWSVYYGFESEFLHKNCIGYYGHNGTIDIAFMCDAPPKGGSGGESPSRLPSDTILRGWECVVAACL